MSSIQERAAEELKRANVGEEDSQRMLEILALFFGQWDRGGAVAAMVPVLMRLIAGKPLSPLTGADDEWIDRSEIAGRPMWQNARCGTVFKDASGKAWDIDAGVVTFPYSPGEG